MKEESKNVGLKLNIQETEIMASGPITPWEIDGETVETVSDFILGGSKITADGDCSHEIKRCFLCGSDGKASAYNEGDPGSIPGSGRSPRGGAWQPTPVFLPGESHGQRSLAGHSPRGHKKSDTT